MTKYIVVIAVESALSQSDVRGYVAEGLKSFHSSKILAVTKSEDG